MACQHCKAEEAYPPRSIAAFGMSFAIAAEKHEIFNIFAVVVS